jgi:spore coat polysaccharide biosynthesis predicted glycosyltransferase SpsG
MESCPHPLATRIAAAGFEVVKLGAERGSESDIQETIRVAGLRSAAAVVVDGPHFRSQFVTAIKQAGPVVLVLADYLHAGQYDADVVWDADLPSGTETHPDSSPDPRLLLGPRYALVRREFLDFPVSPHIPDRARNLLISMGGSDPQNMTLSTLQSLRSVDQLQIRVIVGASNPNRDSVRQTAATFGNIEVLTSSDDMPIQMSWADMAIVAPGVTVYELLYMGVPVVCWPRHEDDARVVDELARMGAAVFVSTQASAKEFAQAVSQLAADRDKRRQMSDAGRELVDGKGAERVLRTLLQVIQARSHSHKVVVQ